MSEIDVKKCEYYTNHYEDKYRNNFFNYCYLYEDKCDKYPQCIYRDTQLKQLKAENERLKELLSDKPIETVDIDSSFEIIKLKNCLDDIEEIVKKYSPLVVATPLYEIDNILRKKNR